MLDEKITHRPTIIYRLIQPTDLQSLEQIHAGLFPIRYELEFFLNVVNGCGIVSWAAVDDETGKLVGFITTRLIPAKESEISGSIRHDSSCSENTLVYILTLGVIEAYRNLGIATRLVQEVIKYAFTIPTCKGIYLHVIDYNEPAIHFYRKMLFKLVRRLPSFYYIQGRHYDSYLFVYFLDDGQSPCSPFRGIMAAVAAYLKRLVVSLAAVLGKGGGTSRRGRRRADGKDTGSLLRAQEGAFGLV